MMVTLVTGALLYVTDVKYFRHHHGAGKEPIGNKPKEEAKAKNPTDEEICCGQHLVCEKTSLAVVSDEIIYYDDEELDRFQGKKPEDYTAEEVEEFRDVLLTLLPVDVAGWARSITLRGIELPTEVKDELLLIITELRAAESTKTVLDYK